MRYSYVRQIDKRDHVKIVWNPHHLANHWGRLVKIIGVRVTILQLALALAPHACDATGDQAEL